MWSRSALIDATASGWENSYGLFSAGAGDGARITATPSAEGACSRVRVKGDEGVTRQFRTSVEGRVGMAAMRGLW